DQRADDRVAEAAAHLEAGRRQLDQDFPGQSRATADDQHVEDGEERNAREDRRDPRAHGEHLAAERPRFPWGAAEAEVGRARHHAGGLNRPALDRRGAHLRALLVARFMIMPPATLTSSVIASRTSAAYMSTWTSRGPASGKFSARSAASVLAGEKRDRLSWFGFPVSIASAMVSPSARP